MLEAAEKAIRIVRGRQRADFEKDEVLVLAITRLLEIIGEAANGVGPTLREGYSHVPWKEMVSLRNRLTHGYFDVDYDVVWQIVCFDIPNLFEHLTAIIQKETEQ